MDSLVKRGKLDIQGYEPDEYLNMFLFVRRSSTVAMLVHMPVSGLQGRFSNTQAILVACHFAFMNLEQLRDQCTSERDLRHVMFKEARFDLICGKAFQTGSGWRSRLQS